MTTYEKNKERIPELDSFKGHDIEFLSDIYDKANKYNLSDKQVAAANKAYDNYVRSGGKTPWEQNVEQWPEIKHLKKNRVSITKISSYKEKDLVVDMLYNATRYKLSEKQLNLLKKLYYGMLDRVNVSPDLYKILNLLTSCSPRSDFAYSLYERFGHNKFTEMTRNDYDKMVSMLTKYKKCLMKRIFK